MISGTQFEYVDYGTYEVKVKDMDGNVAAKRITQTLDTVTTTGEIATLNGTLGEKVVSYTVTNPEVNSNIKVVGKNLLDYNKLNNYAIADAGIVAENDLISDNTPDSDNRSWKYAESNWNTVLKSGTYTLTIELLEKCTENKFNRYKILDIDNNFIYESDLRILTNINLSSCSFSLLEEYNIGIMVKAYDGVYRIQLEEGNTATEWEPYSETNYTIENTSNLPQITTKNGVTHILVENTSDTKLAASYQYIKTVVQ